jgi:predicted ATPase
MISRIETLDYRCLRYIDQTLGPFQLLVGANATGKTTFLNGVVRALWRRIRPRYCIHAP